jgi:alpha-glucosidase
MRDLVSSLHANNQHYIVMVDPGKNLYRSLRRERANDCTAVAYQDYAAFNDGVDAGIFLKMGDGSIYKGKVWPGVTAFPDWFHEKTQSYWDGQFQSFFNADTGVDIDALYVFNCNSKGRH